MKTVLTGAVLWTAFAWVAAADEPPRGTPEAQKTFTNELEVTVANLDVFVRDADGRPVTGLEAADFRVLMDGVEVAVTNFSALSSAPHDASVDLPDSGESAAPSLATPAPPAEPVYVVLMIDNENLYPLDRTRVLRGVRAFVEDALVGPVQMMVLSSRRSVEIWQPFTDDRDAVLGALDRVSKQSGARTLRDSERTQLLNDMEEFAAAGIRYNYFDYLDLIDSRVFKATMQGQITAYIEAEVGILRDTTRNLHEVVRRMSGLDGRRSLVYVSNGLSMTPGLELLHEFAEVFLDTSVYSRIAQDNFEPEFRKLADVANREDVSLYTVDATGLRSPLGFGAEDRFVPDATASWFSTSNQHESLRYMADTTGGIAVLNTNDVTAGLQRIRDDLSDYYSVGYRIIASGDDTAHEVEVQIPDHPEYRVRHRRSFVEKSLDTTVRERVLQALVHDIGHNPMDLRLTNGDPADRGASRWQVPIHLSIPVNRVAFTPDAADLVGTVEVFICVRDAQGRESPIERREVELRIPQSQFSPDLDQRFKIPLDLLFREETHAVAVGVLDREALQTSFARTMVTVP